MRFVFAAVVLLGIAVLFVRRRRFDLFSVGFAASVVYYVPGFFGFTADVNQGSEIALSSRPLETETYLILILLLTTITLAAWIHDGLALRVIPRIGLRLDGGLATAGRWGTIFAVFGFLGTYMSAGSQLFQPDKAEVLAVLDRFYPVWTVGALVGLFTSVATRRWGCVTICSALLVIDVYIGFRGTAAMAVLGLFTWYLSRRGPERLLAPANLRPILLVVFAAAFFFAYKGFYIAIKAGSWDLVRSRLSDAAYYSDVVLFSSEPFLVTGTLNEVVRTDFAIPSDHYADLGLGLLPFAPALGAELKSFNDYFQPSLFPERRGGLASNFLAEARATAGWIGIGAAIAFYVMWLWIGSRLLAFPSQLLRAFTCAFFPMWAFYLHRNDLLYQIVLQRRLLVLFALVVALSTLTYGVYAVRRRDPAGGPQGVVS